MQVSPPHRAEEKADRRWSRAWFLTRWLLAFALDLTTFAGAVGLGYNQARFAYASGASGPIVVGLLLTGFAAGMAGRHWLRAQYYHYVLPEMEAELARK